MNDIPRELNWVKVRAACTVSEILSILHCEIEEDVQEINQKGMRRFEFPAPEIKVSSYSQGNGFLVFEDGNTESVVKFLKDSQRERIVVRFAGKEYSVTPALGDDGKCKLRIDQGEEYFETWQIRRKMLEELFFGNGRVMP